MSFLKPPWYLITQKWWNLGIVEFRKDFDQFPSTFLNIVFVVQLFKNKTCWFVDMPSSPLICARVAEDAFDADEITRNMLLYGARRTIRSFSSSCWCELALRSGASSNADAELTGRGNQISAMIWCNETSEKTPWFLDASLVWIRMLHMASAGYFLSTEDDWPYLYSICVQPMLC